MTARSPDSNETGSIFASREGAERWPAARRTAPKRPARLTS